VSRSRKTRPFRHASREEERKIRFIGYELTELFDDKDIEDFAATARRRIIGEFYYATEKNPRYKLGSDRRPKRRTDNYIWGLRGKPNDLARYVNQHMHRPFIRPSQLPHELSDLNPKLLDTIIHNAQFDVLVMVVQVMRNRDIWYDEGVGIWQACQSSVDEFLENKRAVRALTKIDDRSFHGRVRAQSSSRGIPAGVSVGLG
jgi:hypothetical protein